MEPSSAEEAKPVLTFETRGAEHVLARVVDADGSEREMMRGRTGNAHVAAQGADR